MKLCILDKDGTLTAPISGAKFPQSPTDQQLLPGVREAIDRLRADGWSLAIASNQGGCDWFEVSAITLRVGQRFQIMDSDEGENFFSGHVFNVEAIGASGPYLCVETSTQDFDFATNDRILVQYKTIEMAIEEVQFAADLCGIQEAYFSPVMDGKTVVILNKTNNIWHSEIESPLPESKYNFGGFRKPQPGMLLLPSYGYDYSDRIMIGDRPEDEAAARAAGFRFLDAAEWRNGASTEVME